MKNIMVDTNDPLHGLVSNYNEIKYDEPLLILKNPKTELYKEIKDYVNGGNIPWFFHDKATNNGQNTLFGNGEEYNNLPFFSHAIVNRPISETPFSTASSYDAPKYCNCVNEILNYNGLYINCLYRLNINMTFYTSNSTYSLPHVDHDFPHNNMLIYFNEFTEGEIKIYKQNQWHIYKPEEDDVILFSGLHCHRPPQKPGEFRKVMVSTFI